MIESIDANVEWSNVLESNANELVGLATSSSSKYDAFKRWLAEELGGEPAVCYLSDAQKQWNARVGQALMGMPSFLVLLVEGRPDDPMHSRLSRLHRYVTGLEATVVLSGSEGKWKVAFVVGTPGVAAFDRVRGTNRSETGTRCDPASSGLTESAHPVRQPRSTTTDPSFFELEPEQQAALAWELLLGHGSIPVADAVRIAAKGLREAGRIDFVRLRTDGLVYTEIEQAISYASRRGILFDRPERGTVRAFKADADEFSREEWRDCLLATLSDDEWTDRDTAVRAAAAHGVECYGLDMLRLRSGGRVDTAIRAAISGLIRSGHVERDGREWIRQTDPTKNLPTVSEIDVAADPISHTDDSPPIGDSVQLEETVPEPEELRKLVGHLPPECEQAFARLLAEPLRSPYDLAASVRAHLGRFEAAFEDEQFLDVGGARRLAAQADSLVAMWSQISVSQRVLVQAAILYFVESTDADDDFAINGLRTDKAVMAAVLDALR